MSKSVNILEGESVEEFDALNQRLHSEFAPASETERVLVEIMVQHEWFMRRALRMQQALSSSLSDDSRVDSKRLNAVVRYYRSHERAYSQTKRQLETLRKHKRKVEADSLYEQRQWEQVLKKMPTLSNWVN